MMVTIDVPDVPHPGGTSTATFFRGAARNLRGRYSPGGSNVRATVAVLLDRTAAALDGGRGSGLPEYPDLSTAPDGRPVVVLTFAERQALPAVYHQPVWVDRGHRQDWLCAVCQADGGPVRLWPCRAAARDGAAIAEYAGLDASF